MATRIQLRRGARAEWLEVNPVLAIGEAGFETDTCILRIGDGKSQFSLLRAVYANGKTDILTLDTDSWELEEGVYVQTVELDLMLEEFNPHVGLMVSEENSELAIQEVTEYSKIYKGKSIDNALVFYAIDKPSVDLNIKIKRL